MAAPGQLNPRYMNMRAAVLVANAQGDDSQQTAEVLEHLGKKLTVVPYYYNPVSGMLEVARQVSTGGGAGSTVVDANLTSAGSTKLVGYMSLQPTTPGSSNDYLWVRTVGASGAGSTVVDINSISSSTSHIGDVSVSSGTVTLASAASTNPVAAVNVAGTVSVSGTTTVDLSSAGSTKVVGTVNNATSTGIIGAVSLATAGTTSTLGQVAISNPTTSVTVTSGVVLGAGSSGNTIGSVALVAGTTANSIGSVALVAGTTANTVGSVALVAGSSANTIGNVAQGPGSSNNFWSFDGFAFTSAITSRTSISTTVDTQIVAANANRKAMVIANLSTQQTVSIGLTTNVMTTALGNASVFLPPASQISFGGYGGNFPGYTGPVRGINITSTVVGGGVAVTQFLNT